MTNGQMLNKVFSAGGHINQRGPQFEYHHRILDGCLDFAPNLTLNSLQILMVGLKNKFSPEGGHIKQRGLGSEFCTQPDPKQAVNYDGWILNKIFSAGGHGGKHHRNPEPNTAFKTFILQYFTYVIAYSLKLFKARHALGRGVRIAFFIGLKLF